MLDLHLGFNLAIFDRDILSFIGLNDRSYIGRFVDGNGWQGIFSVKFCTRTADQRTFQEWDHSDKTLILWITFPLGKDNSIFRMSGDMLWCRIQLNNFRKVAVEV